MPYSRFVEAAPGCRHRTGTENPAGRALPKWSGQARYDAALAANIRDGCVAGLVSRSSRAAGRTGRHRQISPDRGRRPEKAAALSLAREHTGKVPVSVPARAGFSAAVPGSRPLHPGHDDTDGASGPVLPGFVCPSIQNASFASSSGSRYRAGNAAHPLLSGHSALCGAAGWYSVGRGRHTLPQKGGTRRPACGVRVCWHRLFAQHLADNHLLGGEIRIRLLPDDKYSLFSYLAASSLKLRLYQTNIFRKAET